MDTANLQRLNPQQRRAVEYGLEEHGANGIVMLTFTPLVGMSEVVMGFLSAEMQIHDGA